MESGGLRVVGAARGEMVARAGGGGRIVVFGGGPPRHTDSPLSFLLYPRRAPAGTRA